MFQAARLHNFDGSVVVAVTAVGMVQPALDQIIDMIAVRDRFMTTARSMNMICLMSRMAERRRAASRIRSTDLDRMLFDDVALLHGCTEFPIEFSHGLLEFRNRFTFPVGVIL